MAFGVNAVEAFRALAFQTDYVLNKCQLRIFDLGITQSFKLLFAAIVVPLEDLLAIYAFQALVKHSLTFFAHGVHVLHFLHSEATFHGNVGDDTITRTEYDIGIVGGFDGAEGKGIKVVQSFSTHGYLQCLRFAYIVL